MKIGFVLCAAALSAVEIVKIPSTPYNERAIIKSMYAETGKLGGKKNPLVLQTVDFPLGVMAQGKTETLKGYRQNANGSTILLWVYGPGEQYRLSIVKQDATPFVENYAYFKDRIRKVLPVLTEYTVFAMFLNSYGESIKAGNAMLNDLQL